jgi:hypothetical protein
VLQGCHKVVTEESAAATRTFPTKVDRGAGSRKVMVRRDVQATSKQGIRGAPVTVFLYVRICYQKSMFT